MQIHRKFPLVVAEFLPPFEVDKYSSKRHPWNSLVRLTAGIRSHMVGAVAVAGRESVAVAAAVS